MSYFGILEKKLMTKSDVKMQESKCLIHPCIYISFIGINCHNAYRDWTPK